MNLIKVHGIANVKYEMEKITPVGMLKDCYGKRDNSKTKNIVRYKVHVLT